MLKKSKSILFIILITIALIPSITFVQAVEPIQGGTSINNAALISKTDSLISITGDSINPVNAYFKFVAATTGNFTITTSPVSADTEAMIYYDTSETSGLQAIGDNTDCEFLLQDNLNEGQIYYLKIWEYANGNAEVTINITGGLLMAEPEITITNSAANLSYMGGQKISISGTVFDAEGYDVTVSATIDGHLVSKTVSGGAGAWTLEWDIDSMNISDNKYQNIEFIVDDGTPVGPVSAIHTGDIVVDKTPPPAPTAVTVTPVGGMVIANSLNKSNTNMTATATITAAEAAGGKAELYLDGVLLATDNSIASEDTQVTFDLGKSTNAELQAAVVSSGTVSVKLYDAAGNSSTSSVNNPVLAVDYNISEQVPPTATVYTIGGTLRVGGTLTGSYTYYDANGDSEGISTFKWYTADDSSGTNKTEIAGANAESYVLTSADIGKYISFEVKPVALTGTTQGTAVLSAWAGAVIPAEAAPTATVQPITGILQVGETLTGHYTYYDVNGDSQGTSTYKWYRADDSSGSNKTEISGATGITYILTSADLGKYISFEVMPVALTGTAHGTAVLSAWAGAVVPAEAAPTATVQPITGALEVGETLTGHYTYYDVNGDLQGTSTYKWYRADDSSGTNKTEIAGANAESYVLTGAELGKYIAFEVTPVALTGTTQGTAVLSTWAGAVVPAEAAPTATVQPITGTLKVGETLTGHYAYSDANGDSQGTSTYKWYRADDSSGLNKAEIAGATGITYILASADIGKYISFEVKPVALTGTTQGTAVLSAWAGAVVLAEAAPTATVQPITGILQVGETLTGHYTYYDANGDSEGTSIFKWYTADDSSGTNKTEIAGANAESYVLTGAELGKYIAFEVTPVALTGTTQGTAALLGWIGYVSPAEAAPTATVQPITGILQVGETLTGHYTYYDVNNDSQGTSIYKWYRADDSSSLNKAEIAGATGITYILASADLGKYISFEVTPVALTGTTQGTAVLSAWAGAVVPAETAPTATVQAITGTLKVGETLTGHYAYSDANGDLEGTSTFKWYRSDDGAGLNKAEIAGANAKTYVLASADEGKYISFEVTPVAATGTAQGTAALSPVTAVVGPKQAQGTTTSSPTADTSDKKAEVLINNTKVNFASSEVKEENGRKKTIITLDDEKFNVQFSKEKDGSIITIPVSNNSDIVIGQLNGQTVKNMEDKKAVIEIKTEDVTYSIPAEDINIDSISEKIDNKIQLKDITVNISVSKSSKETEAIAENSSRKNNYQLVVKPVDFEITCKNGNNIIDVSKFNSYVERTVAIPAGVDPSRVTTGVVLNKDGTFSHVPTMVKVIDGKYYAKISSLTNSTYTVIWNPVTFKDAEKHWSKSYVNDAGSRLIDNGTGNGNFAPDKAITRAEFASMIVKALGLTGTNFTAKFSDVQKSDSYYSYIYTAYEYGILAGYSNGKFGPQDLITREQAMTMLAKAMDIAGMDVKVTDADISNQLELFKDSESISIYARQTAAICVKNGIFDGDTKGRLTPKDSFTRAESATVIIKLLKKAELI